MATRRRSALALGALLVLTALMLSACGGREPSRKSATGQAAGTATSTQTAVNADVRAVRVVLPKAGDLSAQRSASVTVDPARSSLVAAGTSGRVAAVLHHEGSTVEAGETVVQLDTTSLKLQLANARTALESAKINLAKAEQAAGEGVTQAQAALDAAQANLALAQKQADNGKNLYAAGGISATDLQSLEAQLAQARSAYQQAQDALDKSKRADTEDLQLQRLQVQQAQNQVAQVQNTIDEASITAPFAGKIADMKVSEGEFVGTGSTVFRLVSTGSQLARFQVPPQDAQQLTEKGLVYVSYGGLDYASQIIRSTTVPGSSRLVELTARIYPSETPIPTGSAAQINYQVVLARGELLPAASVRTDGGESTVLLVQNGVATQTKVDLVAEDGGVAAVRGLPAGSRVIYPLPSDLLAGAKVRVVGSSTAP